MSGGGGGGGGVMGEGEEELLWEGGEVWQRWGDRREEVIGGR